MDARLEDGGCRSDDGSRAEVRFRRRDAIARARLTVRANRGGGKLGGTRVIGQLAEETATRDPRRRDGACGALRATDRSPRRPVPTPRTSSRAMATTAWLLAPIRATRPIPTLPGADDALARAGSAACASRKRRLGGSPIEGADASSSRPASTDDPPPAPRRPLGVGRPLPPGDYHLDDDPSAVLRYEPRAMRCAPDAYEELWNFSLAVAPTPNPLNHHLNLRRKQATFGARYRFGAQLSERVDAPRDAWPALVRACIADARARVRPERRDAEFAERNIAAHVNWYPDGRAGMGRHRDAESDLVPDAPIFSYTFMSDGVASPPRLFDLHRRDAAKPFATVPLGHGDALVMAGTTQEGFEHAVRTTAAKAHAMVSRVNVTVRAFKPGSDALRK